ncbi:JmjC domain-containing protein [Nonomuraea sp. PA05]|uniref:JmjC domain-containing protein n=1 Tax=Nonomuraea sp. PA05 TaxID=2604466 RepID=UPI0016522D99|nr:cupin domain-containing protein [Nonomuraea sp. PA05]
MSDALASCVGDTEYFFETVLSRAHLYRPAAFDTDAVPVSTAEIDDCVTGRPLPASSVRMAKDNQLLDEKLYLMDVGPDYVGPRDTIDPVKVSRLIDAGATLVVRPASLHLPRLRRFCKDIEMRVGQGVDADLFITPSNARGFEIHADAAESLVIQLRGSKNWTLYEPVRPWEHRSFGIDPPAELSPAAEYTLDPGDFLYVPRGMPHLARTADSLSVHVTISINAIRWSDLLTSLMQTALGAPSFAGPVPLGDDLVAAIREELPRQAARLAQAVQQAAAGEGVLEQILRSDDSMLDAVRSNLLSDLITGTDITAVDRLRLRPGVWPVVHRGGQETAIQTGRSRFRVSGGAADACEVLMRAPAYVKDLADDARTALQAAEALFQYGIAERCPD